MSIPLNQHKRHITSQIIGSFSDYKPPKTGLSVFFPEVVTTAKDVSIEVQRGRKRMASDVQRGRGGNLNKWSTSSEKLYTPPFFEEGFDITELEVYNVTFGQSSEPTLNQAVRMIEEGNRKLQELRDTIELAKENQRGQVLQDGIVTLKNGDNVDYKRKAASKGVLTGNSLWSNPTSKPLEDIEDGIKFCRQEGKSSSRKYNLIFGGDAYAAFRDNESVKKFGDFRNITILELGKPEFNDVTGLTYQGRLMLKNGSVDLWTYDEFYEESNNTYVEFIDNENVILLPSDFVGTTSHAGVPNLLRDTTNAEFPEFILQTAAAYNVNNFVDTTKMAHMFKIYSAPLAIPFSVDRIWTKKVI